MKYFLTFIIISGIILLTSCISGGSGKDVLNKLDAASKTELQKAESAESSEKMSIVIQLYEEPDDNVRETFRNYDISEFSTFHNYFSGKATAETIRKILNSELVKTVEIKKTKF